MGFEEDTWIVFRVAFCLLCCRRGDAELIGALRHTEFDDRTEFLSSLLISPPWIKTHFFRRCSRILNGLSLSILFQFLLISAFCEFLIVVLLMWIRHVLKF